MGGGHAHEPRAHPCGPGVAVDAADASNVVGVGKRFTGGVAVNGVKAVWFGYEKVMEATYTFGRVGHGTGVIAAEERECSACDA